MITFSMKEIKSGGKEDNCVPRKNSEKYLSNEEFKSFKKLNIRSYIKLNSQYVFPQFVWCFFSYIQRIKLGNTSTLKISLDNQLDTLSRSIIGLRRNNICGYYKNIINSYDIYNEVEQEFWKIMNEKGEVSIFEYFNTFQERKKDFLKIFSILSLIVYKNQSLDFLNINSDFLDTKTYINNNYNNENFILEFLLSSMICYKKKGKSIEESEILEFKKFESILKNPIHIKNNEIPKNINKELNSSSTWKVFSVINYEILNNINKICFNIDEKLNITDIYINTKKYGDIFNFSKEKIKRISNSTKNIQKNYNKIEDKFVKKTYDTIDEYIEGNDEDEHDDYIDNNYDTYNNDKIRDIEYDKSFEFNEEISYPPFNNEMFLNYFDKIDNILTINDRFN